MQHFFLQIEAAKFVQYQFSSQRCESNQGSFSEVMDLNSQIRPELDHITVAILVMLKANWPTVKRKPLDSMDAVESTASCTHPPLFDGSAQTGP